MNFPFQTWENLRVQLMSFCYINAETIKWNFFFLPNLKKKHTQVHPMSFYYINTERIGKWKTGSSLSNPKKFTSPANVFLLHKWKNEFFLFTSNEILLHKRRNKKKKKKYIFLSKSEKKNVQVQLTSFYYMNAETIGRWKN